MTARVVKALVFLVSAVAVWGCRRDHGRGVAVVIALTPGDGPLPLLVDCEPDCDGLTECDGLCGEPLCWDHSLDLMSCGFPRFVWHEVCHDMHCGGCQDEAARETNDERTRDAERWPT